MNFFLLLCRLGLNVFGSLLRSVYSLDSGEVTLSKAPKLPKFWNFVFSLSLTWKIGDFCTSSRLVSW